MRRLCKTFLLVIFSMLLIAEAYAQTSFYGSVGIGKTEIKKFETSDANLSNTFLPNFYQNYEIGLIQNITSKFSLRAGGGLANYACVIPGPKEFHPEIQDYRDTHVNFYYISVPFGIRYNPFLNLRVEAGLINNFFSSYSQEGSNYIFQSIKKYDYFKKHLTVPYWGFSYTFYDRVEVGFTDHLYLSNFATFTTWYEQTNGIEPSIFFKYNVWNVYVSYKIRLSKRDE